jgi:FG-GAP-like repeat
VSRMKFSVITSWSRSALRPPTDPSSIEKLCPERTLQVHFELWQQAKFIDNTVGVLLGNGDGTFQPELTYSSGGSWANAIAVADLNGDGRPDIVAANCVLR